MRPYFIKCITADCDTPTRRANADTPDAFEADARTEGWAHTPKGWLCPDCAEPATDDDERPVLSIPVSCGVWAASVPHGMTRADWWLCADVCTTMAEAAGRHTHEYSTPEERAASMERLREFMTRDDGAEENIS